MRFAILIVLSLLSAPAGAKQESGLTAAALGLTQGAFGLRLAHYLYNRPIPRHYYDQIGLIRTEFQAQRITVSTARLQTLVLLARAWLPFTLGALIAVDGTVYTLTRGKYGVIGQLLAKGYRRLSLNPKVEVVHTELESFYETDETADD